MTTAIDQEDYENCIQAICDAVELLRKRKLRADEDRIQALVKQYKRWTASHVEKLIGDAAREGRICKLMYKDNFGYRTAIRISDKMATRIIPFEPEHPKEIPRYVYSLVLDVIKALPNSSDNIGISLNDLLEHLKTDKKLLNYTKAGLEVVLLGLQQKNELIQLKSTSNYAIKTAQNENDSAPVPESTATPIKNEITEETDIVGDKTQSKNTIGDGKSRLSTPNAKQTIEENQLNELDQLAEADADDSVSSYSEASEISFKEEETAAKNKIYEEQEELEADSASVDADADVDADVDAEDGGDQGLDTDNNSKEDKADEAQEEEPCEPSSAPRRRRVNSRYINDFYLTSSSTKGGRGSKDEYAGYTKEFKKNFNVRGLKCKECGGLIGEIGVCLTCLFPISNTPSRRGSSKRKTATTPAAEKSVTVAKSTKPTRLSSTRQVARRTGATTRSAPIRSLICNPETKPLGGTLRKVVAESSESIINKEEEKSSSSKKQDSNQKIEDDDHSLEDNSSRRLSQDMPSSTGEQNASSMAQEDCRNKQRSKHGKDNTYKTFTYNNGLVTDEEQKPQIPLRFIPNRKRPEPDRSSCSNTATSSNLNKKSCIDLDNKADDATATSILDFPTEQSAATTNENNHTTNGIFVPSSTSCSLDDFEPQYWTSEDVAQFISSKGFTDEARLFKEQDVDGLSLLLMQRADFLKGLSMKLGPALKIYDHIRRLKENYLPTSS